MMRLLRVIGEKLFVGRECDSVDLSEGTSSIQVDVLMQVHQLGSKTTNSPLQHAVPANSSRLMREVADILIPVL